MTIKSPRILLLALLSSLALLIGAGCMASSDDEADTSSAVTSSADKATPDSASLSASAVGALSQCSLTCNESYEVCLAGAQSDFDLCMCDNARRSCIARCAGRRAPQQVCPAP
jgi:hypothetical protein